MLNRQSSLRPFALASLRSRAAIASRSPISPASGGCGLTHPFFCQSAKLILVSDHEDLVRFEHAADEMINPTTLLPQFPGGDDERIDLPPEARLLATQK